MRFLDTKHFGIFFKNTIRSFSFFGVHVTHTRRYEYGDNKEHSVGMTICNLRFSIYWKCKIDEWDNIEVK